MTRCGGNIAGLALKVGLSGKIVLQETLFKVCCCRFLFAGLFSKTLLTGVKTVLSTILIVFDILTASL